MSDPFWYDAHLSHDDMISPGSGTCTAAVLHTDLPLSRTTCHVLWNPTVLGRQQDEVGGAFSQNLLIENAAGQLTAMNMRYLNAYITNITCSPLSVVTAVVNRINAFCPPHSGWSSSLNAAIFIGSGVHCAIDPFNFLVKMADIEERAQEILKGFKLSVHVLKRILWREV